MGGFQGNMSEIRDEREKAKKNQGEGRHFRRPGKCSRVMVGNIGGDKGCCVIKGGKHHSLIWRENYGVICKY